MPKSLPSFLFFLAFLFSRPFQYSISRVYFSLCQCHLASSICHRPLLPLPLLFIPFPRFHLLPPPFLFTPPPSPPTLPPPTPPSALPPPNPPYFSPGFPQFSFPHFLYWMPPGLTVRVSSQAWTENHTNPMTVVTSGERNDPFPHAQLDAVVGDVWVIGNIVTSSKKYDISWLLIRFMK